MASVIACSASDKPNHFRLKHPLKNEYQANHQQRRDMLSTILSTRLHCFPPIFLKNDALFHFIASFLSYPIILPQKRYLFSLRFWQTASIHALHTRIPFLFTFIITECKRQVNNSLYIKLSFNLYRYFSSLSSHEKSAANCAFFISF